MSTITGGVTSTPVTGSHNWAVTDADVQHILDWMASDHIDFTRGLFGLASNATPTNGQYLVAWLQLYMNSTRDAVTKWLKDTAANSARNGTSGITIT